MQLSRVVNWSREQMISSCGCGTTIKDGLIKFKVKPLKIAKFLSRLAINVYSLHSHSLIFKFNTSARFTQPILSHELVPPRVSTSKGQNGQRVRPTR